jgi:hypothetical protein
MKLAKLQEEITKQNLDFVTMLSQNLKNLPVDIKEVTVKKKAFAQSAPKQCFNNSFSYILNNESTNSLYVLGYVFIHNIPIEHCFIKQHNEYYDVTLDPKKQDGYVSVAEIPFDSVMRFVNEHEFAPSLYDLNRFIGQNND